MGYIQNESGGGGGGGPVLQTNGVNNTDQAKLNLKNGTNVTITSDGVGGVTIGAAGGGGFDPAVTAQMFDDFMSTQSISAGSNAMTSDVWWLCSGNGQIDPANTLMTGAFGAVSITSGAGCQQGLFTSDFFSTQMLVDGLDSKLFDTKCRFQFDSIDDAIVYSIGFQDGASPQFQAHAIVLLYDQSANANMRFMCTTSGVGTTIVDSGIPADTNPHTVRIRSITPGTILFSIDGGAESAITTNIPSQRMNWVMATGTFGTTTKQHRMYIDYAWVTFSR